MDSFVFFLRTLEVNKGILETRIVASELEMNCCFIWACVRGRTVFFGFP